MSRTDVLDLGRMRLSPGEGRRLELEVSLPALRFGDSEYEVEPEAIGVVLDISRMAGGGYSLRLRFRAALHGPCMRCLQEAEPETEVDVREVDQPGGGDELTSEYLRDQELDLAGWARDAFVLAVPAQVICREDCAGLCPVCGADLNAAGPDHRHEAEPDPRWAKLRELRFE